MRMLLLAVLLSACAAGPEPYPMGVVVEPGRPGPPPQLGTAELVMGGATAVYTTYDFSAGAFDASAWFDSQDNMPEFMLTGYPESNPHAAAGYLRIAGLFGKPPAAGAQAGAVTVEIWTEGRSDGPRLSSKGRDAMLVIDSFTKDSAATSGYGHAAGHFSATLCPVTGDPAIVAKGDCHAVTGSFDTGVQYSP